MSTPLMDRLKQQFSNKKILIIGLGLQGSGVGLARFFSKLGASVTATDLKNEEQLSASLNALKAYQVKYTLGKHELSDFTAADYIFKGPSVPWTLPELVEAQERNIPIEMEASFFASVCPAQIIGITGTRGKTTVAQMLFESLIKLGKKTHLGGNITETSTIELLYKIDLEDLVVLELSSWQLSGFHRKKISPHFAVFTNFYPDHLNFYKNEEEYFFDKTAIYKYQSKNDYLIANSLLESRLKSDQPQGKFSTFTPKDLTSKLNYLKGEHNYENAAAALAVHKALGSDLGVAQQIISDFKGVRFRQEIVLEKGQIIFINDSTSTTPTSTIKALETFTDGKVVLILGGSSKKLPYERLLEKLSTVDHIVLLQGAFTDEITDELKTKFPEKVTEPYVSLKEAVEKANQIALSYNEKTYILFSPGAASFGMFVNEFDRAKQFDQVIKQL